MNSLEFYRKRLDHARQHVARCRAELARFDRCADPANVTLDRPRGKLAEDLRKAEQDAGWAEIVLANATSPTEVAGG